MQGLIAAFGADPTNPSTCQQLAELRRVLAQLWLDVEPVQLGTLSGTPVGEVTQSLIHSGFGKTLLDDDDAQIRTQLGGLEIDFRRQKHLELCSQRCCFTPWTASYAAFRRHA